MLINQTQEKNRMRLIKIKGHDYSFNADQITRMEELAGLKGYTFIYFQDSVRSDPNTYISIYGSEQEIAERIQEQVEKQIQVEQYELSCAIADQIQTKNF